MFFRGRIMLKNFDSDFRTFWFRQVCSTYLRRHAFALEIHNEWLILFFMICFSCTFSSMAILLASFYTIPFLDNSKYLT
jgi:hypothetical protein